MRWGKVDGEDPGVCFSWGEGASKRDMLVLHGALYMERPDPLKEHPFAHMRPSVLKELEARGYDLTTLRFSVSKKQGA